MNRQKRKLNFTDSIITETTLLPFCPFTSFSGKKPADSHEPFKTHYVIALTFLFKVLH